MLEQQHEERSWRDVLQGEKEKDYFKDVMNFVEGERKAGKRIYPPSAHVFSAFALTPFESVKVVIIGQDPYHGEGQAHGLCFSVQPGTPFPPSLQNIFKELRADLGVPIPKQGNLDKWARQGVLLLNAVLTVEEGKAGSHQGKGWEIFTDKVIQELNHRREGIVFLLWGNFAQKKAAQVDTTRHTIFSAAHPSPLSASRGFFGCKHFSKTDEVLRRQGSREIDWALE